MDFGVMLADESDQFGRVDSGDVVIYFEGDARAFRHLFKYKGVFAARESEKVREAVGGRIFSDDPNRVLYQALYGVFFEGEFELEILGGSVHFVFFDFDFDFCLRSPIEIFQNSGGCFPGEGEPPGDAA